LLSGGDKNLIFQCFGSTPTSPPPSFVTPPFFGLPPQVLIPTSEFGYTNQDWPFWCGLVGPWWILRSFSPCPMHTQTFSNPWTPSSTTPLADSDASIMHQGQRPLTSGIPLALE
jgi:hypothetical protein